MARERFGLSKAAFLLRTAAAEEQAERWRDYLARYQEAVHGDEELTFDRLDDEIRFLLAAVAETGGNKTGRPARGNVRARLRTLPTWAKALAAGEGTPYKAAIAGHPPDDPIQPDPQRFVPESDERCGFVMDACTCMKRKGHAGLHACAHGGWRTPDPQKDEQP